MLERFFQLKLKGTTPAREVIGGVTTFAAMAYILAVNPAILKDAGMEQSCLGVGDGLGSGFGYGINGFVEQLSDRPGTGNGDQCFFHL